VALAATVALELLSNIGSSISPARKPSAALAQSGAANR